MSGQPEWISGNIYIRPNLLEKVGDRCAGHTHNFDHTTIVFQGAVHVIATLPDGRVIEQDFVAPAHFLVRANVRHEIIALQDMSLFWCVYSHTDPQGRISQVYTGWSPSYV